MEPDIHVAIVEDDPEIRQLMVLLLENSPGFRCRHEFEDAGKALSKLHPGAVDIILMDIDLPGMSGIECTRELKRRDLDCNILMLTVHEDDKALFDSLCAGATGYLLKETAPAQILAHIKTAHQGGAPMSGAIARRVVATFHQSPESSPLSRRETEVLRLMCDGQTYRTIAESLFVSAHTVKGHIKNIYRKLEVHTRAEAVKRALKDGLV